jgi:hypothetical protein
MPRLPNLSLIRSWRLEPQDDSRVTPIFRQRRYERIRDALVEELTLEAGELRLMELRRRVEDRLGEPVDPIRFRYFVSYQSKSVSSLLERLGYGLCRLRS